MVVRFHIHINFLHAYIRRQFNGWGDLNTQYQNVKYDGWKNLNKTANFIDLISFLFSISVSIHRMIGLKLPFFYLKLKFCWKSGFYMCVFCFCFFFSLVQASVSLHYTWWYDNRKAFYRWESSQMHITREQIMEKLVSPNNSFVERKNFLFFYSFS